MTPHAIAATPAAKSFAALIVILHRMGRSFDRSMVIWRLRPHTFHLLRISRGNSQKSTGSQIRNGTSDFNRDSRR